MSRLEWSIREQLAIAALDIGKLKLAKVRPAHPQRTQLMRCFQDQLDLLQARFPHSPRVTLVHGLRHEAYGDAESAKKVYTSLLTLDETNVVCYLTSFIPRPLPDILRSLPINDS